MIVDPRTTYLLLEAHGRVRTTAGGDAFWSQPPERLAEFGRGWLVSEFDCTQDWPNWEMHPMADELVYLLAGDATVIVETSAGETKQHVTDRGLVLVPRGAWHTVKVHAPSRFLHVTLGEGTRHRPVTD